jgi:hypothetical protein
MNIFKHLFINNKKLFSNGVEQPLALWFVKEFQVNHHYSRNKILQIFLFFSPSNYSIPFVLLPDFNNFQLIFPKEIQFNKLLGHFKLF